jgi:hypothetical protein
LQEFTKVLLHGLAVQPGGVGVFNAAGFARNAAGYAYAHGYSGGAGVGFGLLYQGVDGLQGGLIVADAGWYPLAKMLLAMPVDQDDFGFGATQINAYQPIASHAALFVQRFPRKYGVMSGKGTRYFYASSF